MIQRAALSLLALVVSGGLASADVIHFKHGGTVEGTVIRADDAEVRIRVKRGGIMTFPTHVIKRVESESAASSEYAQRVAQVDLADPQSIEDLAIWASQRGLGEKATQLLNMSRGLRLEIKIARAKASGSAKAYAEIYRWARNVGLADRVRLWILSQGAAIDANDPQIKRAYARFNKDLDVRAERAARRAADRDRPSYAMPVETRIAAPSAGVAIARVRSSTRSPSTTRDRGDRPWVERMRAQRLKEAERQAKLRAQDGADVEAEGAEQDRNPPAGGR